jgi:hypothetical protein
MGLVFWCCRSVKVLLLSVLLVGIPFPLHVLELEEQSNINSTLPACSITHLKEPCEMCMPNSKHMILTNLNCDV